MNICEYELILEDEWRLFLLQNAWMELHFNLTTEIKLAAPEEVYAAT